MSNWDYASEDELEAARQAYLPSDPKSPDYVGSRKEHMQELETFTPHDLDVFAGDPGEVMQAMKEVAQIIAEPVRAVHTIRIKDREYVRVEGWTMLGRIVGVKPIVVWTRALDNGWEARVEARDRHDKLVGAAEAMCTRDEASWKTRDEYAIRSMAQTRATSKALRGPLGFVLTLAGFEATPAEEMPSPAFQPPTVDEKRRLMFSLRDRLAKAGKLDKETFVAQVQDDYGKHPGRLTSEETTEVIDRLTKALEKHDQRSN
jgi:hypothetical protein